MKLGSLRIEDLPPVLTIDEAAAVLRVSRDLIYSAVNGGSIKAARLGSRRIIRIKREVILALLNGGAAPRHD